MPLQTHIRLPLLTARTNIPLASGEGSGGRNHSFLRLFMPDQISVRSPGSAGADQAPEDTGAAAGRSSGCRKWLFAELARLVAREPCNALRHEPRLPSPPHGLRHARSAHDLGGAAAVGRREDDVGAPYVLLRRAAIRDDRLK